MITPMLRPDLFGGFATHAGDALFEACYAKDFPETARVLRDRYDGSYERVLGGVPRAPDGHEGRRLRPREHLGHGRGVLRR